MKQRSILFLISIFIIMLMAIGNTFFKNDVHEWRNDGKCMECHSKHNSDIKVKEGQVIPPPKSHSDQFRKYTHGRSQNFSQQRCASCHLKSECTSCHNVLPESHSTDFVVPTGRGMERHIMLATINPASCLTCHKSFAIECVSCHTAAEVMPWENQARKKMAQREADR